MSVRVLSGEFARWVSNVPRRAVMKNINRCADRSRSDAANVRFKFFKTSASSVADSEVTNCGRSIRVPW